MVDWFAMASAANATSHDVAAQTALVNSVNYSAQSSGESVWSGGYSASSSGDSGAPAAAPAYSPPSIFPTAVPVGGIGGVANPVINPATAANGGTPVAQGFDLLMGVLDRLLQAEQVRQQGINQQVDIARLFSELQRASPTQAADLAVKLGLPQFQPDLSFANAFATPASTGTFGGRAGTQDIKLPFSLNGKELSFLGNNPNVATMLKDIGGAFGRPDYLQTSIAAAIPAGGSLTSIF